MTDIVVYLATNGVTVQDANDAIWWARSAAQEMINQIEESGGFDNPSTGALYGPMRQDSQVPCPEGSFEHTWDWYEREAESRGIPLMEVPFLFMSSVVQMEHQVYKWFGEATIAYDLVPFPGGEVIEVNPEPAEERKLFMGPEMS